MRVSANAALNSRLVGLPCFQSRGVPRVPSSCFIGNFRRTLPFGYAAYQGLGGGLGLGLGVGRDLGEGVGLGVPVAVGVGVDVAEGVGVTVGVGVAPPVTSRNAALIGPQV